MIGLSQGQDRTSELSSEQLGCQQGKQNYWILSGSYSKEYVI